MNNFHYFGLFLDTDTKNRLMDILTDRDIDKVLYGMMDGRLYLIPKGV